MRGEVCGGSGGKFGCNSGGIGRGSGSGNGGGGGKGEGEGIRNSTMSLTTLVLCVFYLSNMLLGS